MIYDKIPEDEYIFFHQKKREPFIKLKFNKTDNFSQHFYDVIIQSIQFFMDDYACFLASYDIKGHTINKIHLGLNVSTNFVSIWDYIGYHLHEVYGFKSESKSYFGEVIDTAIKETNSKDLKKLKTKFDKDSILRKLYRNPFTHEIHLSFFYKHQESKKQKLDNLKNELNKSYEIILFALKKYKDFIEKNPV